MTGPFDTLIDFVDRTAQNFIDEKQQDYWFVTNIQHVLIPGNQETNYRYMIHLVMSRLHD